MSSSLVWVQLYHEGKNEPEGRPTSVKKPTSVEEREWNLDALAKEVKALLKKGLVHVDPNKIYVYPPDTEPPFSQDKAIDPGDPVPTGTTSKNALIVVALAPRQNPANGKKCWIYSNRPLLLISKSICNSVF